MQSKFHTQTKLYRAFAPITHRMHYTQNAVRIQYTLYTHRYTRSLKYICNMIYDYYKEQKL